jgi:FkbM family methyltransferase
MKKVFIDCGYHLGEGMSKFIEILNINDEWEVHAFEANPACEIEKKISNHPIKIIPHNAAVWIENTKLTFNRHHNSMVGSPTVNSTHEMDGWGSHVDVLKSNHIYNEQITIDAIDFSEFLKQFEGCEVYCKFDIEGSEYPVLRKMLNDETASIVKALWIEWHLNPEDETADTQSLLAQEVSKVIQLHGWC